MAKKSADEFKDINNLVADFNKALEQANMKAGELPRQFQGSVKKMNEMVKIAEQGGKLSRWQLGWVQGITTQINKQAPDLAKINLFHNATNKLLRENKDLYKSLSSEQMQVVQELLQAGRNTLLTTEERAMAEKRALVILQSQSKVLKVQNEYLSEYTGWLDDAKKKWKEIKAQIGGVIRSPWTAATVAAGILVHKFTEAKDAIVDMKKELGLSGLQTIAATKTIGSAAAQSALYGANVKEAAAAYAAIVADTGDINVASSSMTANIAKFMKLSGLSADEVAKVQLTFYELPGATKQFSTDMMNFTQDMAYANKVPLGKVMKDIASNTQSFAYAGKDGAKNLITATIMANKLGSSMNTIANAANKMLDIESSLNAEMEASVLLGRSVNLDKARQFAMQQDYSGLTKEIVKQAGSIEQFNAMDILQKQALADAVGIQVDELSTIVNNQGKLQGVNSANLSTYQQQNKAIEDQANIGYAATEWIKMENALLLISTASLVMQSGLLKGMVGLLSKGVKGIGGLIGGAKPGEKFSKMREVVKAKQVDGGGGAAKGFTSSLSKIGIKDALKVGIIAVAIAGAMWIMGKALQEFATVPFSAVGKGLLAMGGIVITMKFMGGQMGGIMKGALALGIMSLALIPAAFAFSLLAGIPVENILAFSIVLPLLGLSLALLGSFVGNIIMGALAIGIMALALIPAALAMQMIKDVPVENMIAFSIIVPLLALAFAGLGFLSPFIAAGALAVMSMAGAIALLGLSLSSVDGSGIAFLSQISTSISTLVSQTMGIYGLAGAFGALAVSIVGLSGSLLLLAPMLPVLAIAGALGVDTGVGGSEESKESSNNEELIAKLDELIATVRQGGVVELDGKKVGEYVVRFVNLNTGSPAAGRKLLG